MSKDDEISILFCSYNGERYLREQLDSIVNQTHENWTLYVSDDGSSDDTLNIFADYKKKLPEGKLVIINGPRKGFAANFLSLIKNKSISSPWYAFSDQDDIWLNTKLEHALAAVQRVEKQANRPILYGGRTTLVDENKNIIGQSAAFKGEFKLQNALLQSYSGGNTMLFNDVLKKTLELLPEEIPIVSHDWYLYLICSAFDGVILYDRQPEILYRQHENNIVGSNLSLLAKFKRLLTLFNGDFAKWNYVNKQSLDFYYENISDKNKNIIDNFYACQSKNMITRIKGFQKSGVYRMSKIESLAFGIINILGKLF